MNPLTKQSFINLLYVLFVCMLFCSEVKAQDAAVTPANNNVKVVWENGGSFIGTIAVVQQGSAELNWTPLSLSGIVGSGSATTNSVSKSVNALSHQSFTGQTVSVSNGQTYGTLPFTGYWIGVNIGRTKTGGAASGGSYQLSHEDDVVILATYLDGVLQESKNIHWNGSATTNNQTYEIGNYFYKSFDEVRITPKSRMGALFPQTASQIYTLDHVYLQRYTRFGGGVSTTGTEQATCNAQIPLTGLGLSSGYVVSSPLAIPPFYLSGTMLNQEDSDPSTHTFIPMPSTLLNALSYYTIRVKDNAVVYPAGTFGGLRLTLGSGFSADLLNVSTLKLLRNGSIVASSTTAGLATASIINSDGSITIGVLSPDEFDEIQYEITTAVSLPGIDALELYYPVIQRFCDQSLLCNTPSRLKRGVQNGDVNFPVYAKAIVPVSIGSLNAQIKDLDYVVDNNPDNYAVIEQLVGGITDYGISVISQESENYSAGIFAGFEIQDVNIGSGAFANRHIVTFYNNGVATGDKYDDGGSAADAKFLANSGRYLVGMKATKTFDEIRISIQSIGSVGVYSTRVYSAVIEKFCESDVEPLCNELTSLNRSLLPVYVDGLQTGTNGNSVGTLNHYFQNLNNIIDANTANYASLITTVGASTTATVAVQDGSKGIEGPDFELYPAGTFVGFDVSFPTVLGTGFLSNVAISILGPDGTVLETQTLSGNLMGIHSSLLSGGESRQIIGFVAGQPFSGVKFSASKVASATWGEIRIYSAVVQKFCKPPAISCSEIDYLSAPGHPLYINGKHTGIFAAFDGNSMIDNSQYAIDNNTGSYATLQLGTTAGSQLGFSVANGYSDFAAKTYVGFDLGTQNWFEMNGLFQTKIELYRDNILVQSSTGDQIGGGVSSALLTGGWQRNIIGTVAHTSFDEARLLIQRVAGVSLGEMRIYNFVVRDFNSSECAIEVLCSESYVLTDNNGDGKTIPAAIEFDNTGYTGVVSGGYGIDNVWNVVSASNSDYATIHLPAAGGTTGSISVATPGVVFPSGTFAGFTVDKQNFIISGGLFTGVTVTTYLNGQQQEQKTNAALIDFTLIVQWFGTPANFYTPGFKTTLPFDEVKISIGGIISGLDQTLRVYGAYVDTRESVSVPGDGSTSIGCYPDLTPTIDLGNAAFTIGTTKNFVVNIYELKGIPTSSIIGIQIAVSPGYELQVFNSSASIMNVSGSGNISVKNTDWQELFYNNTMKVLGTKSGVVLNGSSENFMSSLGLSIKNVGSTTGSSANITVTIYSDETKTYDSVDENNIFIRVLTSN